MRDTHTHTYSYSHFNSAAYAHTQRQSNTKSSPDSASETLIPERVGRVTPVRRHRIATGRGLPALPCAQFIEMAKRRMASSRDWLRC